MKNLKIGGKTEESLKVDIGQSEGKYHQEKTTEIQPISDCSIKTKK